MDGCPRISVVDADERATFLPCHVHRLLCQTVGDIFTLSPLTNPRAQILDIDVSHLSAVAAAKQEAKPLKCHLSYHSCPRMVSVNNNQEFSHIKDKWFHKFAFKSLCCKEKKGIVASVCLLLREMTEMSCSERHTPLVLRRPPHTHTHILPIVFLCTSAAKNGIPKMTSGFV